MQNNILSALKALDVSGLSRAEWISVGMALKEEGFPYSVWDDWSAHDSRYHRGECEYLWKGFKGNPKPVTGGTIVQMAKEKGWTVFNDDGCLAWDDTIEFDGVEDEFSGFTDPDAWDPVKDIGAFYGYAAARRLA